MGLTRVCDPGYVLTVVENGVVVVGCDVVDAATAVDRVRTEIRLLVRGVYQVIASSSAHEIGALLTRRVFGAVFTVELVVSGTTEQVFGAIQLGGGWVRSAMELIDVLATFQVVEAVPAEHHIFARMARTTGG